VTDSVKLRPQDAGRSGFRRLPGGAWTVLAALLVLVFVAFAYRPIYGRFFYLDDFAFVERASQSSLGEILANHFVRSYWESPDFLWRPGWRILFRVAWVLFGYEPAGYMAIVVGLHAAVSLVVFFAVARLAQSRLVGFGAAAFFASSPAYVEATSWPCASYSILPAAPLVLAAGLWMRHYLRHGRSRDYWVTLSFFLASFLFREAAYHLAGLFVAGALLEGRGRSRRELLVGLVPFVVIPALHLSFLNIPRIHQGLGETVQAVVANIGDDVRHFLPFLDPGLGDGTALGVAVAILGTVFFLGTARTRYFTVWTILALFPYVGVSGQSRFMYFVAMPLGLTAGSFADDLRARWPRRAPAALWVCLPALVALQLFVLPGALRRHVADGEVYRNALAWFQEQDLDRVDRVLIFLNNERINTIANMLRLYEQDGPEFDRLWTHRSQGELFYEGALPDPEEKTVYVRVHPTTGTCTLMPGKDVLPPDTVRRPIFALVSDVRVEADSTVLEALRRSGDHDPEHVVYVADELADFAPPVEGETCRILHPKSIPSGGSLFKLDCPGDALFVTSAFDLWTDARLIEWTIDGEPVEPFRVNLTDLAVRVPRGSRAMTMIVEGDPKVLRK